ncbi:flavin reductase family protein [Nonomuraea typhae]|uniref:flavin reductase family protein n=1 Tax=Nonomuraea typhae TaxID=2603600 RepID=UPI0012FBF97B|nr:flavin reductase family protein [Nonomuraea typhae]
MAGIRVAAADQIGLTSEADPATLRRAYGCFPSGVVALCGVDDAEPAGMAASSFTSVSLAPPLVSVCVANESATWPRLRVLPRLGLSVFAEGHEGVCRTLSAKDGDRFAGVSWTRTPRGAVLIGGASAWLECVLQEELPAGDHHIALLRVLALRCFPETAPLVFHGSRFRRLSGEDR